MRNQSCLSLPLRFIQRFRIQTRPRIIQTFLSQNGYNLNMIRVLRKILNTTTSFVWKMCSEELCCTNGHKTRARNWHHRLPQYYWCSNIGLSSSVLQRTRGAKKKEKKICVSVSFSASVVTKFLCKNVFVMEELQIRWKPQRKTGHYSQELLITLRYFLSGTLYFKIWRQFTIKNQEHHSNASSEL